MAVKVNIFDGGTQGTNITIANSGGISGDALDEVQIGNSATVIYDNAHTRSTLAAKIATGGVNASAYVATAFDADTTTPGLRRYFYFTSNPPAAFDLVKGLSGASTNRFRIRLLTTGQISILNANGTSIATSTQTIPLNSWLRLEAIASLDSSAGSMSVKLFADDSTTALETLAVSSVNLGGSATQIQTGIITSGTDIGPFWLEDMSTNDTGSYPGPSVINQAPVANAGPDQTATVNMLVSLDGTGSSDDGNLTYSWVPQNGSANVAVGNLSGSQPTYTPTNTGTDTWQLTVTDTGSLTSADIVVVNIYAAVIDVWTGTEWATKQMGAWTGSTWR